MRIDLCCMVRDELDVLPVFLEHHLRLFDHIAIVDHRSKDGTREFLARLEEELGPSRLVRFTYDGSALRQSELSTFLARRAFQRGADWVMVLDADEFLAFASREELEEALAGPHPVVNLSWRNIRPIVAASPVPETFEPGQEFVGFVNARPREKGKVALSRAYAAHHPGFRLPDGNHSVVPNPFDGRPPRVGDLLHLPARSVPQAMRKIANQIRSLDALGGDYPGDKVYRKNLRMLLDVADDGGAQQSAQALEAVVLWYEGRAVRAQEPSQRRLEPVRMPEIPTIEEVRTALHAVLRSRPRGDDPQDAVSSAARRRRRSRGRVIEGPRRRLWVVPWPSAREARDHLRRTAVEQVRRVSAGRTVMLGGERGPGDPDGTPEAPPTPSTTR